MTENTRILLGGLWRSTSRAGLEYLAGTLGGRSGARLLLFRNTRKREDRRDPDYLLYLAPHRHGASSSVEEVPEPSHSSTTEATQ